MGKKKAQKSISDVEDLSNDSLAFSQKEDGQFSPKSPVRIKNKDYSFLESTKHKPKKEILNLKVEPKGECAELNFEGISIKIEDLQDEEASPVIVSSDRLNSRNQFLEINEDIQSYYQLMDTIEVLDALIIKYCKDPLLETIMLDMKRGNTNQKDKIKIEDNKTKNLIKIEEMGNKKESMIFEDDSEMDDERGEESKENQAGAQNQQNNNQENQKIANFSEPLKLTKFEHINNNFFKFEEDSNSILSENECYHELEAESIAKLEERENEENPEEFKIEDINMKNLGELLSFAAVFVDQFSASQFKKLFQLKKTLSMIQKSVDKSIKNQLDAFHAKQKTNEGGQLKKKVKHNKNEEDDDDYHVCRVCWLYFDNGHQLGGHMSKKHPGHSLEYRNKELIKTRKIIERHRRLYFKMIRHESVLKKSVNSKRICKKIKIECSKVD